MESKIFNVQTVSQKHFLMESVELGGTCKHTVKRIPAREQSRRVSGNNQRPSSCASPPMLTSPTPPGGPLALGCRREGAVGESPRPPPGIHRSPTHLKLDGVRV